MKLGAAKNTQWILNSDPGQFRIANEIGHNSIISIGPTFDYYINTSKSRPYIGLGIVHNFLTTNKNGFFVDNPSDPRELSIDNKIGFLLRAGVDLRKVTIGRSDLSKFILGLEFNYIPKADVKASNGQKLGTIANSYLALSIGYVFGDVKEKGQWSKWFSDQLFLSFKSHLHSTSILEKEPL